MTRKLNLRKNATKHSPPSTFRYTSFATHDLVLTTYFLCVGKYLYVHTEFYAGLFPYECRLGSIYFEFIFYQKLRDGLRCV